MDLWIRRNNDNHVPEGFVRIREIADLNVIWRSCSLVRASSLDSRDWVKFSTSIWSKDARPSWIEQRFSIPKEIIPLIAAEAAESIKETEEREKARLAYRDSQTWAQKITCDAGAEISLLPPGWFVFQAGLAIWTPGKRNIIIRSIVHKSAPEGWTLVNHKDPLVINQWEWATPIHENACGKNAYQT